MRTASENTLQDLVKSAYLSGLEDTIPADPELHPSSVRAHSKMRKWKGKDA
jgi:hypothetical protein